MRTIVVGKDDNNYVKIPTRINEIYHYKLLAESLQIKYPKRWRDNRNIEKRILSFHSKAKRIAEDFARKVSKKVINEAIKMNVNVIKLENLKCMIKKVKNFLKSLGISFTWCSLERFNTGLIGKQKKNGLLVKYVLAYYSPIECPRCNNKMKEISYRRFKCNCGYENDRDVIVIKNLNGSGSLNYLLLSKWDM